MKALSESPTAVAETAPSSSPDARGEQALEEFQGAGLDFHQFVDFVEHAVELKTVLDREIPQGTSPLWWRKFKRGAGVLQSQFLVAMGADKKRNAARLRSWEKLVA